MERGGEEGVAIIARVRREGTWVLYGVGWVVVVPISEGAVVVDLGPGEREEVSFIQYILTLDTSPSSALRYTLHI